MNDRKIQSIYELFRWGGLLPCSFSLHFLSLLSPQAILARKCLVSGLPYPELRLVCDRRARTHAASFDIRICAIFHMHMRDASLLKRAAASREASPTACVLCLTPLVLQCLTACVVRSRHQSLLARRQGFASTRIKRGSNLDLHDEDTESDHTAAGSKRCVSQLILVYGLICFSQCSCFERAWKLQNVHA